MGLGESPYCETVCLTVNLARGTVRREREISIECRLGPGDGTMVIQRNVNMIKTNFKKISTLDGMSLLNASS
ncbi:hypothetical protein chiPu_0006994 [Chiloscyllium punctatum]|uniref:Uncharacterized protein n=1 Tax=Chiloscyllium punctatum TaxID=137246 RepID=A0A401SDY6_CHIPU|nr:hypothetical protein [Chiloscyllium punctatum]